MARRFSGAALAAAVASALLMIAPATAVASVPASPSGTAVHHEPWHDPHCARDGRWHDDPRDEGGHIDPRCPRW